MSALDTGAGVATAADSGSGMMQPGLAEGAAAWLAHDIDTRDYLWLLTPEELRLIDSMRPRAGAGEPRARRPPPAGESPPIGLPGLASFLEQIRQRLEQGIGFCVLRGLPVERYTVPELEALLIAFGRHLGRVMPQSRRGELLTHVRAGPPVEPRQARGYQRPGALPFHSDSADVVGLLCRCPALSGGESAIASTYAVHNALLRRRPDLLATLYRPFCIDRQDEQTAGAMPYYETPVFMWHRGQLFSRFNPGYVFSAQRHPRTPRLSDAQVAALEALERLFQADAFRLDMRLDAGDLQLVNNNRTVHARADYEDDPRPGRRRHLLRLWLFTGRVDGVPEAMRERYRDVESWRAQAGPGTDATG